MSKHLADKEIFLHRIEEKIANHRNFITFASRSDGRVARHSSAKAATAVRIRFRPQKNPRLFYICGDF